MESLEAGAVQVVEPGSKDDPFSTKNVSLDPAATQPDPNQSQPSDVPGASDEGFTADDDAKLLAELEEQIQARVAKAHSGLDKKVGLLTKQAEALTEKLEAQEKAGRDAERRARTEGLGDEQKAVLDKIWEVEDREKLLGKKQSAVDEYLRQVKAYDLVTRYEKYGLTAEHLEDAESVDEMDLLAEKVRGDFLETGKKPAPLKGEKPAGADAKTDLGGSPPGAEGFKLGTERGVQGMADNVRNLFKQPGNIK